MVHVIPNGFDAKRLRVQASAGAEKRSKEHAVVVALCRLTHRKGVVLLAQLLPRLCRARPDVRVVVGAPRQGTLFGRLLTRRVRRR